MRVMRRLKDESGQVMVVTILSMSLLIGFLALAVDVGTLFRAKRLMQTAADSAAIAAAQEWQYGDGTAAAYAAAAQNGVVNGVNGGVVTVNPGPTSGPFANNTAYYEAIVSQSQPTFFGKIFTGSIFRDAVAVTARAVATLGNSQGCVYTLGTSVPGISWAGSGSTNIPNCSILDDSSLSFAGSGSVTAQSIGIVGSYSKTGSGSINPNPPTVIAAVSDPLAFLTPPANPGSCQSGASGGPYSVSGSTAQTLQPGCYNGLTLSGSGAVTLAAGIYYINGPLSINGSGAVSGTNVTFYLPNSNNASVNTNGSGALNLAAPTTGAYNGILFYQNPSNTNAMSINGSGGLNLQGILYAPGAPLTLNGSGSSQFYTAIVTSSLTFNGSGSLQDYAIKNSASPLTAARLVE